MTEASLIALFYIKRWPYTPSRGEGKNKAGKDKQNTNRGSIFLLLTRGLHQEGASLLLSLGETFPEAAPAKATLSSTPRATRMKSVQEEQHSENPWKARAVQLSCDSQHSWLFNATMKCHHLVKATAVLSPTDTHLSTHGTKRIWDSTIKILLPLITTSQALGRH